MNIVDNSPELDLSKPDQAALLEGKPVEPAQKTPEKVQEPTSISESKDDQAKDEGDPRDKEIKGLKAELARRSGQADRVKELEERLAKVESTSTAAKRDEIAEAIQRLDDKDLIAKQTDWEDELAAARAKYERAEETGNEEALRNATARITHAKRVLTALKQEHVDRSERKVTERNQQQAEADAIQSELTAMYDQVAEVFPDFKDPNSDLWKAGNKIYTDNPALMRRLGPSTGELVAAAMAIVQTGAKGTSTAARKEVINSIEKGFGKALKAGAASPNTSSHSDWSGKINSGEDLNKFNAMIDRIKQG